MECNKEEATKAIKIAERKLSENDYNGAKRFARKAKTLYPTLDGLEQISTMVDVYISASNKTNGSESDWYGILGVDPLADEEAVKKQYKKLALLLHPDKNRFNGAEGAFKLVLHAWSLLSDRDERYLYDERRVKKKPPPSAKSKDAPSNLFWTMCSECKTRCEYWRDSYLNRTVLCPTCGKTFIATEQIPRAVKKTSKTYNVLFGYCR